MPLYAFGSNGSGQLGIGSTNDIDTPKPCPLPNSLHGALKKVVAGGNHTLILFDDGAVCYSGSSRDGRVQSNSSSISTKIFQEPDHLVSGEKAKLCSAWWDGSVFIDTHDCVWTSGSGLKGERGIGGSSTSIDLQEIRNFPPNRGQQWGRVVDVNSGVDHTVVVTADGRVWGWGNGRKGQLAGSREIVWVPRRFEDLGPSVARAVCGRDFTFLMREDGNHTVLGTNKWGLQSDAPEAVSNWKDVGASWGSIFILREDGKVESWGRNDHGQLAPPGLPEIEQLAVGSEHVVALTKDGRIISWGWGEHGNCGTYLDKNGDGKRTWNEIPVEGSEEVLGVGAGCATSFFWTESSSIRIRNT